MTSSVKGVTELHSKTTSLSKATIDTNKLLKNIQTFKDYISVDTLFMAVVKADAYRHGAVPLAHKMEKSGLVDYFGVAQLQEGLELRAHNIITPILMFNSLRLSEVELAIKENITFSVFSKEIAREIVERATALKHTARVHLKIDSGMARLGISTFQNALELYKILNTEYVHIEGLYTHFADATDTAPGNFSDQQFVRFKEILQQFTERAIHFDLTHTCNTAATINFPNYHLDMVRIGIGMHGIDPTTEAESKLALAPIQSVEAVVTQIKDFPAGESVGYSRTYFSKEPMKIATVAIGYADGVAKSLSNKASLTYKGQKLPIIGLVCMDQLMVDCSKVDDLAVGDYVSYFGDPADKQLLIKDFAKRADSTAYELFCRIGNRVDHIYLSNGANE